MTYNIEEKISFIKEIHKKSIYPIFIFDENKNIIFYNDTFKKSFCFDEINDKKCKNFFSHFIIEQNEKKEPFNNFPINNLVKDSQIFASMEINNCDFCYKIAVSPLGIYEKKKLYYASIFELYTMKEKFLEKSMNALVNASLLKDNETGNHVKRINEYSYILSEHLMKTRNEMFPEINDYFIHEISKVASLHDIGKIGTPDYILTKPSKLTEEEFTIIKEHTINGALILSGFASDMARDIALFHHEKWDGSGYPYGMFEDQIPVCARIVSISDVYDALRMKRYYKDEMTHEEAKKLILKQKNIHFQKEIVEAFEELDKKFDNIYNTLSDEIEELNARSMLKS